MWKAVPSKLSRADAEGARRIHEALQQFARTGAQRDLELGRLLLEARRKGVHVLVGEGSFRQYAERVLELSPRQIEERLRVAEALETLPLLTEALGAARVHWSSVREMTRVATPETEGEWLAYALGKTAREVERKVAGHQPGDRPQDRPTAEPPRRVHFDVSASTWALLQEARQKLTRDSGSSVSDDELVLALAHAVLGGAGERNDGLSAYQIAITVCDQCKVATQKAGVDQVVVDEVRLDKALCDAQHLGSVDDPDPPAASQSIPPRIRSAVLARHGRKCAVPGCRHGAHAEVHHLDRLADGGTHDPERMVLLCDGHHTAVHLGTLRILGRYSEGFRFEHADGRVYGDMATCPARDTVLAVVQSAMENLGFTHTEAQAMVAAVRPHVGADTTLQEAVQMALRCAPVGSGGGSNKRRGRQRRRSRAAP